MPVRVSWLRCAATTILLLVGCRHEARLDRLTARGVSWMRCEAARDGEYRPANRCFAPQLLASESGVPVTDTGAYQAAVTTAPSLEGPLAVVTEAFWYTPAAFATEDLLGRVLEQLPAGLARAKHDDSLSRWVRVMPMVHQNPSLSRWEAHPPSVISIPEGDADRGSRLAYAAWAWPGPVAHDVVQLDPIAVPAAARLGLGFAVAPGGWAPGSPPVRFRVLAGDGSAVWERTLDPAGREQDRGWQDAEVTLPGRGGGPQSLQLVADVAPDGLGVSYPVWAQPTLLPHRPAPALNVVLISLDTVRADHLSLAGYALPTTPALDDFAAGGVVFRNAFSTFPSTTASHFSMLTSLQPCAHGSIAPGGGALQLPLAATTLAEAFAAAGWTTLGVTEDGLIDGKQGFARGFDRYVDLHPTDAPLGMFPEGIRRALAWLPTDGRPTFLFLHTYQPHIPYKVPPHLRDRFPIREGADETERQRTDYDAGLCYTDELLAGFLRALEERGLLDHTLVAITSDHGTEFGEHGGIGHARGVFDEQVHVPLVLRHPRLAAGGRRIDVPVSLVDLAPTLLDAAGVAVPASFAGRSLLPLLRGGAVDPSPVFAEQLWGARQTLWRTATQAAIRTAAGTALYELATDPGEQRDLAAARPAATARAAAQIDAFRTACTQRHAQLHAAGAEHASPLDPERRRALEALGYVQ